MNEKGTNSYFFKCACGADALECNRFEYDKTDQGFDISIWSMGKYNIPMSWRERFRWCWRILRTGNPWADSIIATNKSARELAEFILQNLPKEENNEETKTNKN